VTTAVLTERIAEAWQRFKAKIAGVLYVEWLVWCKSPGWFPRLSNMNGIEIMLRQSERQCR
jgi:hypothetical protein